MIEIKLILDQLRNTKCQPQEDTVWGHVNLDVHRVIWLDNNKYKFLQLKSQNML